MNCINSIFIFPNYFCIKGLIFFLEHAKNRECIMLLYDHFQLHIIFFTLCFLCFKICTKNKETTIAMLSLIVIKKLKILLFMASAYTGPPSRNARPLFKTKLIDKTKLST